MKTAFPGTNLAVDWSPLGDGVVPEGLFPAMVSKVKAVVAQDAAEGQFHVLGGFLRHQGESDAGSSAYAKAHEGDLVTFIDALRTDLPVSGTAPVVLVKEDLTAYDRYLLSAGTITAAANANLTTWNAEVRRVDDWAATNMRDAFEVDTAGVARVARFVHLPNVSELTLGSAMASVSDRGCPDRAICPGQALDSGSGHRPGNVPPPPALPGQVTSR